MREYLKRLPTELKELISLVAQVSCQNKMSAYLVGGFVRDLILEVKNLDLDIVVEADAIKFAEAVASRYGGKIISHKRFGTATLVLDNYLKKLDKNSGMNTIKKLTRK